MTRHFLRHTIAIVPSSITDGDVAKFWSISNLRLFIRLRDRRAKQSLGQNISHKFTILQYRPGHPNLDFGSTYAFIEKSTIFIQWL